MNKKVTIIVLLLILLAVLVHVPVSGGKLTSWYGIRFSTDNLFHCGSDIGLPIGNAVSPISWGEIKQAGYSERNGYFIIVSHLPGLESRYLHLDSVAVNAGEKVSVGDVIGYSGNSGYSTGPHLHFEIRLLKIPLPAYLLCLPNKVVRVGIRMIEKVVNNL